MTLANLSLTKANLGFGEKVVVRDVSFDVSAGEKIAVLGVSGAGKTTLLKSLAGLIPIVSGKIETLGVSAFDLQNKKHRSLRQKVAHVSQTPTLIGMLTAVENVLIGSLGSLILPRLGPHSYGKKRLAAASLLLSELGLAEFLKTPTHLLSGGQQQRVGIARALMQNPSVLLADEPTSSLDEIAGDLVLRRFTTASEAGVSVVCSFHNIPEALSFASRVIVLNAGAVILDEANDQLEHEKVRRLVLEGEY
jgi:phosphonate transport system ATP-binding protein